MHGGAPVLESLHEESFLVGPILSPPRFLEFAKETTHSSEDNCRGFW